VAKIEEIECQGAAMTESARNGYVLVGVDYGPESVAAAKWAVDDAQARGRDVVLAHGIPLLYGDAPMTADMVDQIVADAQALVDGLMSQLVIPPSLTVQAVIEPRPPVALLRRLAESADLVVLGRHHQNLFERMTEGSITSPLSAHAPCPVMVVPAEYGWAAGYRKPVVVALDATTAAGSALEFAFDEAAQRQVDLTVLHAGPLGESAVAVNDDLVTLAEILAGWKADRPDVTVHTVILPGEPAEVIVDASTEAGVMVVGRPHQPRLGSWTRSVARAVLRAAHCPLAVVPPSQLSESGPASSRPSTSTR
jgi:nucleotide-binding universal stress UspA family protein